MLLIGSFYSSIQRRLGADGTVLQRGERMLTHFEPESTCAPGRKASDWFTAR
jgi:hypothetical protein